MTSIGQGTIAYMSPEQARGETVDHRTDIWSLGVVLFEIVTGQLPFKGEHDQSVIYSILNEIPKTAQHLRPDIPRELDRFVDRALAKDPDRRYQTIADMRDDLKAVLEGVEPKKAGSGFQSKYKLRKRRIWYAVAAAALSLMIAYLGLSFLENRKVDNFQTLAVLPLKNLSGDTEQEFLSDVITDALDKKRQRFRICQR